MMLKNLVLKIQRSFLINSRSNIMSPIFSGLHKCKNLHTRLLTADIPLHFHPPLVLYRTKIFGQHHFLAYFHDEQIAYSFL